ncbi:MAG: hypothetical protein FJ275_02630, partial [Planctomycetes bacterium]|nr:hypothetical protein [Planctomycetota bacterium]
MAKRVARRTGSVRAAGARKRATRAAAAPRTPTGRRARPRAAAPEPALDNGVGMRMVPIPAGTFTMGSPRSEPERNADEQAVAVTISRPFFMSAAPVT